MGCHAEPVEVYGVGFSYILAAPFDRLSVTTHTKSKHIMDGHLFFDEELLLNYYNSTLASTTFWYFVMASTK